MAAQESKGKIAVILIRSRINLSPDVKKTLSLLKLGRKNSCAVVRDTPTTRGMLRMVKDYVTWGEISDAAVEELRTKRGKTRKNKKGKEVPRKVFPLHPPRGGFERKGIKISFTKGGALGYRGDKITMLLKRML